MTTKNKQKQITIRFSEDDYFKLQVLANKENLTVTQYIRMRSLKRYKNIVIANEALIKKLQEQNDLKEVELQTIKFELIERLATTLRRITSQKPYNAFLGNIRYKTIKRAYKRLKRIQTQNKGISRFEVEKKL